MTVPLLHASLTTLDREMAISLANKVFLSGADVIEISNTLLKRHGFEIVSDIRRILPKTKIYVDTKIIENIEEEGRLAYEAGADVISIHSSADEEEILGGISYVRKIGLELSLDLTGVKDIVNKIFAISYLTPDFFYYRIPSYIANDLSHHTEIFRAIKDFVRMASAPVIIAGIKNPDDFSLCIRLGVRALSIRINETNLPEIEELIRSLKRAMEISFP